MGELLKDKVCIVTGSVRGIGKEIARMFASEGAEVVVNGTRPGSADSWIAECELRDRLHPFYFDVSDPEAVRRNVMAIKKQFGHIDVLVNNAGIEFNELIGMISRENMEKMFRVNVYGMIEMIQTVSRIMARNENGGSIINISSMVGLRGNAACIFRHKRRGNIAHKVCGQRIGSKGYPGELHCSRSHTDRDDGAGRYR